MVVLLSLKPFLLRKKGSDCLGSCSTPREYTTNNITSNKPKYSLILESVKNFATFWYTLVGSKYIIWPKQFKLCLVTTVIGSIVVVGVLRCCALVSLVWDLKTAWSNLRSFNWVRMLQKPPKMVEQFLKAQLITISRQFKKFPLDCSNLNDQLRSSRSKTVNSKVVLQANLVFRWAWHLTILNCTTRYQNNAKKLIHPIAYTINIVQKETRKIILEQYGIRWTLTLNR